MSMDRVTCRFPTAIVDELDELANSPIYNDRCEVLREAYREWRENHRNRIEEASAETPSVRMDGGGR